MRRPRPLIRLRQPRRAHHGRADDPGRDPEPPRASPKARALHATGRPHRRPHADRLPRCALGTPGGGVPPPRGWPHHGAAGARRAERRSSPARVVAPLARAALSLAADPPWRAWPVPPLIGMPAPRLRARAEQGRCARAADVLEDMRTTPTDRLPRAAARHMPPHAGHRAFPDAPFPRPPDPHARGRPPAPPREPRSPPRPAEPRRPAGASRAMAPRASASAGRRRPRLAPRPLRARTTPSAPRAGSAAAPPGGPGGGTRDGSRRRPGRSPW